MTTPKHTETQLSPFGTTHIEYFASDFFKLHQRLTDRVGMLATSKC